MPCLRPSSWLAGQARRLLRALGLGGDEEEGEEEGGVKGEAKRDLQAGSEVSSYEELRSAVDEVYRIHHPS